MDNWDDAPLGPCMHHKKHINFKTVLVNIRLSNISSTTFSNVPYCVCDGRVSIQVEQLAETKPEKRQNGNWAHGQQDQPNFKSSSNACSHC